MEKIERQTTTVINIDEFAEELDRRGTINDIENLCQDCQMEIYDELAEKYRLEVQKNQDLIEIIRMYELFVTDQEIIDKMNTFIEIKKNRIARVVKKYT